MLDEKKAIRRDELSAKMNEAFGGKQSEGKWNSKDADDAMELGVKLYILSP